jgi:hypothetical protein
MSLGLEEKNGGKRSVAHRGSGRVDHQPVEGEGTERKERISCEVWNSEGQFDQRKLFVAE